MSRKLRRKALWLVLLELVSLIVMGVFLTTMQSRLSLENYREDIRDEMEQVSTLLEEAKTEEQETIETDDEIYQSKAESIAFMANNDVDFQATNAKMREYADLLQVDNVLVVDRDGKQIARAQETAADFTYQRYNQLKTVFTTNEPAEPMEINTDDLWARYYSARIDDETMIVIEQNPEQLH